MRPRFARRVLLVVAMVLPTALAWLYFVTYAGQPVMRWLYPSAKVLQAALPLIGWGLLGIPRRAAGSPGRRGAALGLASGVVLGLPVVAIALWLADLPLLGPLAEEARMRLEPFSATTPLGYLALAAVLSLVHSLFEEYYWRWFVYAELRRHLGRLAAVALASASFALHHVVVVDQLLGAAAPVAATLAAAVGVALAGACWCLLLDRHGLFSPWLSHVVADVAVFGAGALLLWP